MNFDETDVLMSKRDTFFSSDFVYSDNIMFSFGVTEYDQNPDPIEDPSIGVLKPYYKNWGLNNTLSGVEWVSLPTRDCTLAEMHLRN